MPDGGKCCEQSRESGAIEDGCAGLGGKARKTSLGRDGGEN